ncbi:release factor glutamine methyltransferase PrmC [Methyloglobulus morosus KoM1]|uniref:Release factor glutamine methyltransferase n=1 Tax=Methyloglobulus morosus KoM1 TaxID=1116472 RepID=V5BZX9_9GAMM|nr:peptide chain release factor N(5)-glutamine methyltransferase [Methyloglobulus morosus]ESS71802.1 release factor glutamine methyltransferase PrmC [Methyloglobulus morosus KoM1]
MPTLKSTLAEAVSLLQATTESPLLDAELLLCHVLGKDRSYLRAWPDAELNPEQLHAYRALVNDRRQGKPIAYLTGTREFWSRDFHISPDVLIPRPDTELLIELSLALIPTNQPSRIIDLGTGSGIIAITLAAERPAIHVSATDISATALQVAKANAARHQVERIQFCQSHWFDDVPTGKFDLVVSNPPYLASDDEHRQQGDLRFEPLTALVSAQQGLSDIQTIAETARNRLENGGFLLVEHGYNQKEAAQKLFRNLGYHNVQTHHDLSGQPRVTLGQYLSPS